MIFSKGQPFIHQQQRSSYPWVAVLIMINIRLRRSLLKLRIFLSRNTRIVNAVINLVLLILVYCSFKIIYESYLFNEPIWYITRYRVESLFTKDPNAIFFKKLKPVTQIVHKDIRNLLRQEHWKYIETSDEDYDEYFRELEGYHDDLLLDFTDYKTLSSFMEKYLALCLKLKLKFQHPERVVTNEGKPVIWDTIFLDDPYERLTYDKLKDLMEFDDFFLKDLRLKHEILVSKLPTGISPYFTDQESGYVLLGSGKFSWYSLLAIQSLRKSGSILPVELIIPLEQDLDLKFCDLISGLYNAQCKTFKEIFQNEHMIQKLNLKGYQLKSLAMIGSSFKNTMYLDSDIFCVENPDYIFESQVFRDFGFITWPDYWRRTSSPLLYENLGKELDLRSPVRFLNDFFTPVDKIYNLKDPKEQINFHDIGGTLPDWTTESGILLINKSTHFQALLLSLYYNLNGPTGYYPLLSQGGAGEGDKETWLLSAHILNQTYYQVNRLPDKTYGTWIKDRNWIIDTCIVQVDPVEDYKGLMELVKVQEIWRKESGFIYNYDYTFGKNGYEYSDIMSGKKSKVSIPRDMFYHLHSPKLDPWDYILDGLFTDRDNRQMRNFGEIYPRLGWDFELWVWENIRANLCENNAVNAVVRQMQYFEKRDFEHVCTYKNVLNERIEWLRKDGEKNLKA